MLKFEFNMLKSSNKAMLTKISALEGELGEAKAKLLTCSTMDTLEVRSYLTHIFIDASNASGHCAEEEG